LHQQFAVIYGLSQILFRGYSRFSVLSLQYGAQHVRLSTSFFRVFRIL
jgi:hypothetical protein